MSALPEPPALGVIVCCRDEERTVARRLANLAASQWPGSARRHRVVVVDDGSKDATVELARRAQGLLDGRSVRCEVIENREAPGKPGSIVSGARHLQGEVDVLVLTDADVLNAPDALARLAAEFAGDPRLGMACGSQRFVESLHEDGTTAGVVGDRGGLYDRFSDLVRAVESRSGRVFSVHGQLLAWRADLGLAPRPGFAADDLDLMRQVRTAGLEVRKVAQSTFFEVKRRGAVRRIQAVRRARAYFQFVRALDPRRAPDRPTRWQWRAYRWGPRMFPWLALTGLVLFLASSPWILARVLAHQPDLLPWLQLVPLSLVVAAIAYLWEICTVILEANYLERRATLSDRWSTKR